MSNLSAIPGMAHFVATGPAGETCNTCAHAEFRGREKDDPNGAVKPITCTKWRLLMGSRFKSGKQPAFSHTTAACKYHARTINQPISEQGR